MSSWKYADAVLIGLIDAQRTIITRGPKGDTITPRNLTPEGGPGDVRRIMPFEGHEPVMPLSSISSERHPFATEISGK